MSAKQFQTTKCGTDQNGNYVCPPSTLEVDYAYDSLGQTSSVNYPGAPAPYIYSSDGMGRHNGLTSTWTPWCDDNTWVESLVQNVTFDYAGRLSGMQFRAGGGQNIAWSNGCQRVIYLPSDAYETESRTYTANGQLSTLAWAPVSSQLYSWAGDSISYLYSSTQNNGQIAQMSDSLSGETALYGYDQLKRLTAACSSLNGCSAIANATTKFQYDGFGNLVSKTLNGTTSAIAVNGATNQLTNAMYDLNGNMTSGSGVTLAYDVTNRAISSSPASGGTEYYGYAPDNKRVWRYTAAGTEEWTFWGARGEKLGTYQWAGYTPQYDGNGNWTGDAASFTNLKSYVWFDRRLISDNGQPVMPDRLGTNKSGGARFYPYGEEITSTANDREKFATYFRDSFTGLDYADQRMYASTYGRFTSPDRYSGSAGPKAPLSWNRYAYVLGDPINRNDRNGLCSDSQDGKTSIDSDIGYTFLYGGPCQVVYANDDNGPGGPAANVQVNQEFVAQMENDLGGANSLIGIASTPYLLAGTVVGASELFSGLTALAGAGAIGVGAAETPQGQQAINSVVVNLGGEGEVAGAINQQGSWILESGWASSQTGQTLTELQQAGNQFVISSNTNLPFANGSVGTVITNNVPIGGFTWLGPGVQPVEVWRILQSGGTWINNGTVIPPHH